jgi:hypothetical protein
MNDASRFRSKSAIYSWKSHMAIENVADLFVATLEQAGVKRVYRIVGDSPNGIPTVPAILRWVRRSISWDIRCGPVADHLSQSEGIGASRKLFFAVDRR